MPPITTVDERDARAMVDRALAAGVNLIDTADVYADRAVGGDPRRARSAAGATTCSSPPRCGFGDARPGRARRTTTSSPRARRACAASAPTTSTSTSCTVPTAPRRSRRRCARSTTSSRAASCAPPAPATSGRGRRGRGGAPARARPPGVHRRAALLLAGRARGRARADPRSAGPTTSASSCGARCRAATSPVATPRHARGMRRRAAHHVHVPAGGSRRRRPWGRRGRRASRPRAGVSMAQVALAWVLAQPGITSAIVGASSLEQLDDNLAAAALVLTADELAALDAATALAPIYPAWWDPAMGIPGPNDLLSDRGAGMSEWTEPRRPPGRRQGAVRAHHDHARAARRSAPTSTPA